MRKIELKFKTSDFHSFHYCKRCNLSGAKGMGSQTFADKIYSTLDESFRDPVYNH
jgi:hypothetical protein